MTWIKVLFISLASAVLTAGFNCIHMFERTSLTAPAETLELWIVLALFIIMNCKGYKEAMIKTFVFFLISQPLIYLIEVPFKAAGWSLFQYYPYWAVLTVLTIPGAAIAYRVKNGDIISALILSVANFLMIFTGFRWLKPLLTEFPHYLIATAFCFIVPFVLSLLLLKEKKPRLLACILAAAFIVAGFITQ